MIYIDFMGGLHGNFLAYAINSLDADVRTFDIFTEHGTSHNEYPKKIAIAGHYMSEGLSLPESTNIISITADTADCLLVNLLCYDRAGDYNFNLKDFNINFRDQVINTKFEDVIDQIDKSYGTHIRLTNTISRGILREYFKWNFKKYSENNIIQKIKKQKYNVNVLQVDFKNLYNFDTFIDIMYQVIDKFSLEHEIDLKWYLELWNRFISKIDAIEQNHEAYNVYHAVLNNQYMDIDFNLLQESWLNSRLEIVYNKEMPFNQEIYFKNTQEILDYLK